MAPEINPLYGPRLDTGGEDTEESTDGGAAPERPVREALDELLNTHSRYVDRTAARLAEIARTQVDLWRRVPALALEADGRTGHSGDYQKMYRERRLELRLREQLHSERGLVDLDLTTGELLIPHTTEPAPASNVSRLHPDDLDAAALIARLESRAQEPHGSYYDADEKERWRAEIRARYGLERPLLR